MPSKKGEKIELWVWFFMIGLLLMFDETPPGRWFEDHVWFNVPEDLRFLVALFGSFVLGPIILVVIHLTATKIRESIDKE